MMCCYGTWSKHSGEVQRDEDSKTPVEDGE